MMTRLRALFILLTITILSYLVVDIGYRVLGAHTERIRDRETGSIEKAPKPTTPAMQPLSFYTPIAERNLFGTTAAVGGPGQIDIEELEPTKLRLKLLGTVAGGEGFDYAIIEETATRKQGLFRVGDTVASATIVKIVRGMVVLRAEGRDEVLRMDEKAGTTETGTGEPTAPEGGTLTVNKSEIEKAMSNMNQFLTQARIQPFVSGDGAASGFIISRIQKGSIFQKMGMQNGDIIQEVNGQPIQGLDQMMDLYKGLQSGSEITLRIKRRGTEQDLQYIFE